jgi:hypothetical protein
MPFLVRGFYNNNPLTLTTETEEAFAKAFDWRLVEGFTDALSVTASRLQGLRNRAFAALQALKEIDQTIAQE